MRISDWSSDVCSSALNPEIDGRSATPLALLFHELATNAAKYGALSLPDGRVKMEVKDEDGQIRIDWREEGGPSTVPPTGEGFGSRLMQSSVARHLGATRMRGRVVGEGRGSTSVSVSGGDGILK